MTPRMLSVQSHVVSGYCGNKSATLPLQLLGFEVDVLNSVQLSNHTQYKYCKGHIFDGNHLGQIHECLQANNLLKLYDNVLSGYVGNVGFIESMAKIIKDIKNERDIAGLDFTYTLDPVLGDTDCDFYVPDNGQDMIRAYRENLLPIATIITPNAFEASLLTGIKLDQSADNCIDQCVNAITSLHDIGIEIVALTSVDTKHFAPNEMVCFLSRRSANNSQVGSAVSDERDEIYFIRIPKLASSFYGTGDLFAALITAWLKKTQMDLKESLEKTVNTIQTILLDTYQNSLLCEDKTTPLCRELRLIKNQACIPRPPCNLRAHRFEQN